MNDFLKTKKGLEYLLETFPNNMPVQTAISKYNTSKVVEYGYKAI